MSTDWIVQVVWSGYRGVDTFFFISGMLVTRALLSRNFCIRNKKKFKTNDVTTPHEVHGSSKVPPAALEEGQQSYSKDIGEEQNGVIDSAPEQPKEKGKTDDDEILSSTMSSGNARSDLIVDAGAWNEVMAQNPLTTCITFLTNYVLYIINRYMR